MSTTYKPIITRIDTSANWRTLNPTPANNEQCIEVLGNGLFKLKIGDGVSPWIALNYYREAYTGNIDDLKTPDKTSIVAAINSLQAQIDEIKETLGGDSGQTLEEILRNLIVEELNDGIEIIDGSDGFVSEYLNGEIDDDDENGSVIIISGNDEEDETPISPLKGKIGYAVGDTVIDQGYVTGPLKNLLQLKQFNVVNTAGDRDYADEDITNTIKLIPANTFDFLLLGGIMDDFRKSKPMGTINDYRLGNTSTFYGGLLSAIKTGLEQLKNSGKIILVLPHNNVEPAYSNYPSYYQENELGYTLERYVRAAKECAIESNIPYADVNAKSNINENTANVYLKDGYNVTVSGGKLIANIIYQTIMSTPYFKD